MEISLEETSFVSIFSNIEDPRCDSEHKLHRLIDIIVITVCAVICRCETWDEIAEFGEIKKPWFKKYLELPHGIPSHDTFRRVFMLIDPQEFNRCFCDWTQSISSHLKGDIIPIDGKTVRGSFDNSLGRRAIHMVSAWSSRNGIVLSQEKVSDKSNEITAIPEVLKSLNIQGAVVTLDAMGCQKTVATQIIKQKGDYVFGLKGNHKRTSQRVEEVFTKGIETNFKNMDYDYYQETNEGHGRHEERNYFLLKEVGFFKSSKDWAGLKSVGMVESITNRNNKISYERRYYLTSLNSTAEWFGECVRKHWQVENNLHWVLDVNFNDDDDRKRVKNSASNFSMVKRAALNILKRDTSKGTMKTKRLRAALNEEYLERLLFQ